MNEAWYSRAVHADLEPEMTGGLPGIAIDELVPGSVIAGRYRIEHVLGAGGMGVVLAARHITLEQRVAIKLMLPHALVDQEAVERFIREAWAASRINSEYVTRVFDMGELPNGAPYIVMEHLDGADLGTLLKRERRLDVAQSASFGLQICEALAEAHALGIVHRDLKPSNVFCVQRAGGMLSIKVLDFGISKLTVERSLRADLSLTSTRSVIGSPLYMSPEQLRAPKTVDARADIWSLGVVLYEMLSGALPFNAETLPELAVRVATENYTPLTSLRPDLPRSLCAAVHRCLEKNRELRFADVSALAQALAAHAPRNAQMHAERVQRVLGHSASDAAAKRAVSQGAPATPTGSRRRLWPLGVLVLGAAALAAAIYDTRTRPVPAGHVVMPLSRAETEKSASTDADSVAPVANRTNSSDETPIKVEEGETPANVAAERSGLPQASAPKASSKAAVPPKQASAHADAGKLTRSARAAAGSHADERARPEDARVSPSPLLRIPARESELGELGGRL